MEIYHCTIILDLDVANKFAFCYTFLRVLQSNSNSLNLLTIIE